MTTAVQLRRGTTAETATFTGLEGETTVDTTKDTLVVHNGSTAGGFPIAREDLTNVSPSNLPSITGDATASDDKFLIYDQSALTLKQITRAELNNAMEQDPLSNVQIVSGTINGTTIGGTTAAGGSFTTLNSSGATTLNGTTIPSSVTLVSTAATQTLTNKTLTSPTISGGTLNNISIGASTASTGAFTTLSATGVTTVQAGTVSAPAITTSGDTNTGIFFPAADTIAFSEGGAEAMRIDSSGNLGLGVTPSAWFSVDKALQVGGTFSGTTRAGALTSQTNDPVTTLWNNAYRNASTVETYFATGEAAKYRMNRNAHEWYTAPSGTAGNAISFAERMRIDSAGNVGIGTSSPAARLHAETSANEPAIIVQGNTNGSSTSGTGSTLSFRGNANAGSPWEIYRDNGSTGDLVTTTVSGGTRTEAMRITLAGGNVGIGTSSPGARFHTIIPSGELGAIFSSSLSSTTEGTGQTLGVVTGGNGSASSGALLNHYSNNASGVRTFRNGLRFFDTGLIYFDATAERMRIDSSGNLLVGGTSALQSAKITSYGSVSARNGGVDGTFANAFVGVYSINSNEHNVIQTAVSSSGTGSGFRFKASDGGGSSATTTVLDLTRTQTIFYTGGTERARIDSSGNLLVGTTTPGAMQASSQSVVVKAGVTGVVNARNDSVADNGTVDITVFSGGGGFAGLLVVQNILVATANSRTQTTFSVLGRGTDAEALQISTRNGSTGGSAFSVTFPSTGVIRITNTSGGTTSITASFFGNQGF